MMKHKAIRIDNLMYKGCEPHWQCTNCGMAVPFHCYTKEEFEQKCCGCHKIRCDDCEENIMIDCNDCPHLNITEEQQEHLRKVTKHIFPHICTKYNQRVLHCPYPEPMIHPCQQCEEEKENNNETHN